MTREFVDGYLYKITGLSYESEGNSVCNVLTEHTFLAYGEDTDGECLSFIISEFEEIEVAEGAVVERLQGLEVGYTEDDGTARFIVVDRIGYDYYVVASLY